MKVKMKIIRTIIYKIFNPLCFVEGDTYIFSYEPSFLLFHIDLYYCQFRGFTRRIQVALK